MKPLFAIVVAILVIAANALPENIEDVKELPQSKEPVVEAEESEPQERKERCSACSGTLSLKSPKDVLAAIHSLPNAEVHTQESFEECSSEKGCAGIKLKDGKLIQKYGDFEAFKAAALANNANGFQFQAADSNSVFKGGLTGGPFWWMNENSPFKDAVDAGSGHSAKFSKFQSSSFSSSTGGGTGLDISSNPFLNGDFSKLNTGFSNAGSNFAAGQGFEAAASGQGSGYGYGVGQSGAFGSGSQSSFGSNSQSSFAGAQNGFGQGLTGAQGGLGGGQTSFNAYNSASKFSSTGYTGSSPAPFSGGSNINLIQNSQKSEFDQQTQQNIDELFQSTGNVQAVESSGGDLQQTCSGQGYICVQKAQCNNGVVNTNGGSLLQANTQKQYCNTRTEVCCRLEISSQGGAGNVQGTLGIGSATFAASNNQGLFSQTGQNSFGASSGYGAGQTSQSSNNFNSINRGTVTGFGTNTNQFSGAGTSQYGASFGSNTNKFAGTGFDSTLAPTTNRFGAGNINNEVYKATSQSNFVDSFSSGSENNAFNSGSLKPGIPYLPPVDASTSGSNVVSTAFVSSPRPFITPRPVSPPRPFTSSRPTFIPTVSSTSAPGYLPPVEPLDGSESRPSYVEGGLVLDDFLPPSRTPAPPVPFNTDIPAGCAAALKCTPIEYCTAEGVISNTTVILSRDQDAYRVPLTDCKDIESGRIGKCCRDPYYTDPWPVNQLGKWVPDVFGGNDGKYIPDSRGSPNNPRPVVTARPPTPPVTGSVYLNNFINTPKTPQPFGPNQVTPGFPTNTVKPFVQKNQFGQGSFSQKGVGQYEQGSRGVSTAQGQGQIGLGGQGQIGSGSAYSQTTSSFGQTNQVGVGQTGQFGVGQTVTQGQGSYGQAGRGQIESFGQGVQTSQGAGFGVSQISGIGVTQGAGVGVTQGAGFGIKKGQGFAVSQGQGQVVSQGVGQGTRVGEGFGITQGGGAVISRGQGTTVTQGSGFGVTQGQGTGIRQGSGFGISQGKGSVVSQSSGFGITQGQGTGITQGTGYGINQGQGTAVSQGAGIGVTQGQGTAVSQGVGFGVTQGQGTAVSQGSGFGVSQGQGTGVSQGTGFGVSYGQGSTVAQGSGFGVSQGQGVGIRQGSGFGVTQGQGVGIRQGAGFGVSQGQGVGISQGGGFGVSQGQGSIVSQGGGFGVSQGQGTAVSQGGGYGISQGTGFGIRQGQGTGIRQGVGFGVSQGSGVGIGFGQGQTLLQGQGQALVQGEGDEQTEESVHRVYLSRYGGSGQCGIENPQKPYGNRRDLEVDFAEIPWQAMVLLQTNKSLLCGGVITRPDVVITTASCVEGLLAKNVLIKGGEWKLGIDEEPLPFQIVQVKNILRHPFYQAGSLRYDAAILVLEEDLRLASNIWPICLPSSSSETLDAFYNGAGECIVTGWGKIVLQAHLLGSIMHGVNVSLLNPGECQNKLQEDYPHLLDNYDQDSCVCGQPTNPANNICKVDTGSALACTTGDGSYVLRGIYSWESNCQVGNQLAAFYRFDLEWYEWAIGLIESVRFAQYTTTTRVTKNKVISKVTGSTFTSGVKGGVKGSVTGVKTIGVQGQGALGVQGQGVIGTQGFGSQITKGFGIQGQDQTDINKFGLQGQSGEFSQFGATKFTGDNTGLNFGSEVGGPLSKTFTATFTEKKVFKTEPKFVTYTTKPEIVTFTTKPEIVTFTTKPEYYTFTTKPKIFTYTTKPEIVTYTTKPEIVTYTTKPKIVSYTTKPQFITYETSGTVNNPKYVSPNLSFSEVVGAKHTHSAQCKCLENGRK